MKPIALKFCVPVLGSLLLVALSACGGGGGGSSDSGTGDPGSPPPPPPPAATYTVGGTISGLSASGLILANGSATVSPASGASSFTFQGQVSSGASYDVTVQTQPATETCTVASGSGTVGSQNVSVAVTCTVTGYPLTGSLVGLSASGLTLAAAGQTVSPAANATSFTFQTPLAAGATYNLSISTQPTGLTCVISAGAGSAGASNPPILVTCGTGFTVGGTITGYRATDTGLVLNDGKDSLIPYYMQATGLNLGGNPYTFTFPPLASGKSYAVTVTTQPAHKTCTVGNGTGTIGSSSVSNVTVSCLGGSWAALATMPTPRGASAVAVLNNLIYVIAGEVNPSDNTQTLCFNTLSVYDPSSDSWSSAAPFPLYGYGMRAVTINGVIYVFGGNDCNKNGAATSAVYAYDASGNSWTQVSSMPNGPLTNTGVATDGTYAYVVGGYNPSAQSFSSPSIQIYDPSSNSWHLSTVALPDLAGVAAFFVPSSSGGSGSIEIAPGYTLGGGTSSTYLYFPDSDQAVSDSLPFTADGGATGVALGSGASNMYVFLQTSPSQPLSFYNWAEVTQLANPNVNRLDATAVAVNGSIYLVGGVLPTGVGPGTGDLESYQP
jgi:hypothetical protein